MTPEKKDFIDAYSPEMESTVLACMLNSEDQFAIGKLCLVTDDFFESRHRRIFGVLLDAYKRNGVIDLPSVITFWKETQLPSDDEYLYLLDLANMSDRYQNIEYYCQVLQEFSMKRSLINVYQETLYNLKEGLPPPVILQQLLDKVSAIKEHQKHGDSVYRHLLTKTSEQEIIEEIKNISSGARVGMQIGAVDLKIPGGALSIVAGPTGHGKTLLLINMILNYLSMHPDESAFFFSFEESRAAILSLFLNTYINEDLSCNNRESIKSYFRGNGDVQYINANKRELFLQKKEQFFKSYIESGRLNIFYSDYSIEALSGVLSFLKKNTDVGIVGIDYTQFLRLQNKKNISRQEELKQICLMLKDCAIDTGLPLLLAAQFNRTVVNEGAISPVAIGEAGDIERAANMIIGLWNRNYQGFTSEGNKGKDGKTIPKESSMYLEILKGRETGIGHSSVFDLNGNTGRLSPQSPREPTSMINNLKPEKRQVCQPKSQKLFDLSDHKEVDR